MLREIRRDSIACDKMRNDPGESRLDPFGALAVCSEHRDEVIELRSACCRSFSAFDIFFLYHHRPISFVNPS